MSGRGTGRGSGRGRGRGTTSVPIHERGRGRGRGASQVVVFRQEPTYLAQVDPKVKRTEYAVESSIKQSKSTETQFPDRPGFGTQGKEILLWTNYFELTGYGNLVLYRYSIALAPGRNGRKPTGKKLKRIIQILLEEHLDQYGSDIVTDFKSNILSKRALELRDHYDVAYRNEEEQDAPQNPTIHQVTLHQTAVLSTSELLDYVTSTQLTTLFGSKEELIQALNIVLGHHPKAASSLAHIGSNKHYGISNTSDMFDLGAGLRAIRGFFTSVRVATARVLVNVQVKNAAFYNEGPLDGLMHVFIRDDGPNKVRLENFLKKLSVNVTHIIRRARDGRVIPRMKQISALANRGDGSQLPNPPIVSNFGAGPKDVQFFLAGTEQAPPGGKIKSGKGNKGAGSAPASGQYISVYDFFKRAHNIVVKDASLPVVNVGTRQNPSYLPAQVCEVRHGQHFSAKLSPFQTQNMIKFAVRSPEQNASSITTSGIKLLGFDPVNPTLQHFGLKVDPKLQCVPGRILNGPTVRYHGTGVANTRFGSWNLQSVKFSTTPSLPYWTYLAISFEGNRPPWGSDKDLQDQIAEFTKKLNEVGITALKCTPGMPLAVNKANAEMQIDNAIHRFMHSPNRPPPKFLLVILPAKDTRLYNRIKYTCDIKEGLLNICAVSSKFMKPRNDQYFANVSLKVNLKLGGNNHTLESAKLGVISQGKTMVVGLDVTHPSPGSSKSAPSIAGVVASVDRWLGQWPAELHILPPRQEMITGLSALIKTRLKLWQQKNRVLPENILIYRDGVSEGQYNLVLENELPSFRTACKELYTADQTKKGIPRITIIVVGKRHNTRFYPTRIEDADRSSNPPNGTVVDRGVTEARNWDFFLQAHAAIQGTARPAHYFIVLDEIFCRQLVKHPFENHADALQDLTHNLCYLFGRATKAVSICPPAYYADLLCERARCYLSGLFDPEAEEGGSVSTQSSQSVDASAVKLHPHVKDSMFYL